jgi:hypothetical protein
LALPSCSLFQFLILFFSLYNTHGLTLELLHDSCVSWIFDQKYHFVSNLLLSYRIFNVLMHVDLYSIYNIRNYNSQSCGTKNWAKWGTGCMRLNFFCYHGNKMAVMLWYYVITNKNMKNSQSCYMTSLPHTAIYFLLASLSLAPMLIPLDIVNNNFLADYFRLLSWLFTRFFWEREIFYVIQLPVTW